MREGSEGRGGVVADRSVGVGRPPASLPPSVSVMTTSSPGDDGPKGPTLPPPQTPVLTVGCRMLRSPSHESVTTDLSLFSVSSVASEAAGRAVKLVSFKPYGDGTARGPSPNPDSKAAVRPPDIPEILWFEEENDLIRSCAALSSALGLSKSFSTSDISQLPSPEESSRHVVRSAVSDLVLSTAQRTGYLVDHPRLEHASRSCSTWVAVGDVASTSQLPSPHGGHTTTSTPAPPAPPFFTAADLIRSVNKKVRQNYIRRRLLTTYKALERLSQSEFNLDRLELAASAAAAIRSTPETSANTHLTVPGTTGASSSSSQMTTLLRVVKQRTVVNPNLPLTVTDVERERGKPLSKYDRNMMIFNWLHTLDEAPAESH